jgi:hypothetical protein
MMMKVVVENDKILNYLLKVGSRNDKSKFLNKLGFYEYNWQLLKDEIIQIFHDNPKALTEENEYGNIYNVTGILKGPNNTNLHVKTIWINLNTSNEIRFVTLFPDRS